MYATRTAAHVHLYTEPIFCLNAYLSHYRNPQLSDYLVDLQFGIPRCSWLGLITTLFARAQCPLSSDCKFIGQHVARLNNPLDSFSLFFSLSHSCPPISLCFCAHACTNTARCKHRQNLYTRARYTNRKPGQRDQG